MTDIRPNQLFTRHDQNPILTPSAWPYTVNAVFNPGAALAPSGETVLLVRVEDRSGISHLTRVSSENGVTDWRIDPQPIIEPRTSLYHERLGIEDPRITFVDGRYVVAYTGLSPGGPLVCLSTTNDLTDFDSLGAVTTPEDKDAALFPVKFGGRFAMIHRPVSSWSKEGAHIWISFSPDLIHWGEAQLLIPTRPLAGQWDQEKVGLGPPPLATDQGWLILFHGVKTTATGLSYRSGLALLDLDDPTVVKARTSEWVIGPEAIYERTGNVPGVVFPTGWIASADGLLRLYYGAADTYVCLASARVADLVEFTLSHAI
jgi:predicted GH43/DUF377 family glycosyl hydrolase